MKHITFKDFQNDVLAAVNEIFKGSRSAVVDNIAKLNDAERPAILLNPEKNENRRFYAAPAVYLEPFYDAYLDGADFNLLVESVVRILQTPPPPSWCLGSITDYEKICDKVVVRVLGYERNRDILTNLVYVRWLDLAITFGIYFEEEDGMIRVTEDLLEQWNISLEELLKQAIQNTKRIFGETIRGMESLFIDFRDCIQSDEDLMERLRMDVSESGQAGPYTDVMYLMTNKNAYFGAGTILYSEQLHELADFLHSDLYILPSSIHELILVPAGKETDPEWLQHMVREVNETQVASDEILTDSVYCYNRKKKSIDICLPSVVVDRDV